MKRFLIFAFFIFAAAHSDENNFSINDLEKYLNNIKEISADFSQVDKNGISEGSFSLNRPKKFMQMIFRKFSRLFFTKTLKKSVVSDEKCAAKRLSNISTFLPSATTGLSSNALKSGDSLMQPKSDTMSPRTASSQPFSMAACNNALAYLTDILLSFIMSKIFVS